MTLIKQMISSWYCSLQWQRTKKTEAWLSRQHDGRKAKGSRVHAHSLSLCQWQLCLAGGYSICVDSGKCYSIVIRGDWKAYVSGWRYNHAAQRTLGLRDVTFTTKTHSLYFVLTQMQVWYVQEQTSVWAAVELMWVLHQSGSFKRLVRTGFERSPWHPEICNDIIFNEAPRILIWPSI